MTRYVVAFIPFVVAACGSTDPMPESSDAQATETSVDPVNPADAGEEFELPCGRGTDRLCY